MYKTELCTLCDLNVNGDEYHYIMICPYFRHSRKLYLKHYFYTRPNMLKFSQLFSSDNKPTLSRLAKLNKLLSSLSLKYNCIIHPQILSFENIVYKFLGSKQSFFASLINNCIYTNIYIIYYTQIYLHI